MHEKYDVSRSEENTVPRIYQFNPCRENESEVPQQNSNLNNTSANLQGTEVHDYTIKQLPQIPQPALNLLLTSARGCLPGVNNVSLNFRLPLASSTNLGGLINETSGLHWAEQKYRSHELKKRHCKSQKKHKKRSSGSGSATARDIYFSQRQRLQGGNLKDVTTLGNKGNPHKIDKSSTYCSDPKERWDAKCEKKGNEFQSKLSDSNKSSGDKSSPNSDTLEEVLKEVDKQKSPKCCSPKKLHESATGDDISKSTNDKDHMGKKEAQSSEICVGESLSETWCRILRSQYEAKYGKIQEFQCKFSNTIGSSRTDSHPFIKTEIKSEDESVKHVPNDLNKTSPRYNQCHTVNNNDSIDLTESSKTYAREGSSQRPNSTLKSNNDAKDQGKIQECHHESFDSSEGRGVPNSPATIKTEIESEDEFVKREDLETTQMPSPSIKMEIDREDELAKHVPHGVDEPSLRYDQCHTVNNKDSIDKTECSNAYIREWSSQKLDCIPTSNNDSKFQEKLQECRHELFDNGEGSLVSNPPATIKIEIESEDEYVKQDDIETNLMSPKSYSPHHLHQATFEHNKGGNVDRKDNNFECSEACNQESSPEKSHCVLKSGDDKNSEIKKQECSYKSLEIHEFCTVPGEQNTVRTEVGAEDECVNFAHGGIEKVQMFHQKCSPRNLYETNHHYGKNDTVNAKNHIDLDIKTETTECFGRCPGEISSQKSDYFETSQGIIQTYQQESSDSYKSFKLLKCRPFIKIEDGSEDEGMKEADMNILRMSPELFYPHKQHETSIHKDNCRAMIINCDADMKTERGENYFTACNFLNCALVSSSDQNLDQMKEKHQSPFPVNSESPTISVQVNPRNSERINTNASRDKKDLEQDFESKSTGRTNDLDKKHGDYQSLQNIPTEKIYLENTEPHEVECNKRFAVLDETKERIANQINTKLRKIKRIIDCLELNPELDMEVVASFPDDEENQMCQSVSGLISNKKQDFDRINIDFDQPPSQSRRTENDCIIENLDAFPERTIDNLARKEDMEVTKSVLTNVDVLGATRQADFQSEEKQIYDASDLNRIGSQMAGTNTRSKHETKKPVCEIAINNLEVDVDVDLPDHELKMSKPVTNGVQYSKHQSSSQLINKRPQDRTKPRAKPDKFQAIEKHGGSTWINASSEMVIHHSEVNVEQEIHVLDKELHKPRVGGSDAQCATQRCNIRLGKDKLQKVRLSGFFDQSQVVAKQLDLQNEGKKDRLKTGTKVCSSLNANTQSTITQSFLELASAEGQGLQSSCSKVSQFEKGDTYTDLKCEEKGCSRAAIECLTFCSDLDMEGAPYPLHAAVIEKPIPRSEYKKNLDINASCIKQPKSRDPESDVNCELYRNSLPPETVVDHLGLHTELVIPVKIEVSDKELQEPTQFDTDLRYGNKQSAPVVISKTNVNSDAPTADHQLAKKHANGKSIMMKKFPWISNDEIEPNAEFCRGVVHRGLQARMQSRSRLVSEKMGHLNTSCAQHGQSARTHESFNLKNEEEKSSFSNLSKSKSLLHKLQPKLESSENLVSERCIADQGQRIGISETNYFASTLTDNPITLQNSRITSEKHPKSKKRNSWKKLKSYDEEEILRQSYEYDEETIFPNKYLKVCDENETPQRGWERCIREEALHRSSVKSCENTLSEYFKNQTSREESKMSHSQGMVHIGRQSEKLMDQGTKCKDRGVMSERKNADLKRYAAEKKVTKTVQPVSHSIHAAFKRFLKDKKEDLDRIREKQTLTQTPAYSSDIMSRKRQKKSHRAKTLVKQPLKKVVKLGQSRGNLANTVNGKNVCLHKSTNETSHEGETKQTHFVSNNHLLAIRFDNGKDYDLNDNDELFEHFVEQMKSSRRNKIS